MPDHAAYVANWLKVLAAYVANWLKVLAAYVANWLKVLNDDKRAIFTAAVKPPQAAIALRACCNGFWKQLDFAKRFRLGSSRSGRICLN